MRLLQARENGDFNLTEDLVNTASHRYAILSHTWGPSSEEVSFKDLADRSWNAKSGYKKLQFCSEQAARDGLQHFWVDTCCINKDSSAELSEAIISMFRWYQNAWRCYVYLSDVSAPVDNEDLPQSFWEPAFRQSRWFKRGWTLQELLAPQSVQFFSKEGRRLGDKKSLERQIHETTGIEIQALRLGDLSCFTVAERMAWASNRDTTREEDNAYCLLGIFQIFILPMYGEGQTNAFRRLQYEINQQEKALGHYPRATFEASRGVLTTWLQPASVGEDLQELLNQRYSETCKWIFGHPDFINWRSGLFPMLWLHGKPGSGKSVLTAALIECLQAEDCVTAYFFCKLGDDSKSTFESILRTWLWQLLEQMPQFCTLALKYRLHGPGIRSQLEMIKDALREIIMRSSKPVYFIVDGFDECESGPISAEKLITFMSTLGGKNFFALTSRPESWIRKALYPQMEGKCRDIPVVNLAAEKDLNDWIRVCILEMQLSDPSLQQLAIRRLQQGADGMFLWARFQLEALEAQFAVEDAKAVLQNDLPNDLEAT